MMGADRIGRALKGRRNGNGWLVRCPCPNHGKGRGDSSPSLSVHDGDDGRLLLRCFAGCEFLDILDALKRLGAVEAFKPSNWELDRPRPALRAVEREHEPDPEALQIWRNAKPASGTVVAEYL